MTDPSPPTHGVLLNEIIEPVTQYTIANTTVVTTPRRTKLRRKPKKDITAPKLIQTKLRYKFDNTSHTEPQPNTDHGSGDLPVEIDEDTTIRLLSKNPRGLSFESGNEDKVDAGVEYLKDMQAGVFLTQETNVDWKQKWVKEKYTEKLIKYWKHAHVTTSASTKTARKSSYLPGGTCTTLLGKWTSRIMERGSDPTQGRWSWVRLQGNKSSNGKRVNIRLINAYRVCQKYMTEKTHTSYMQQYEIQIKEGIADPQPFTQVITDLIKFINECKKEGDEIILCLDANEEMEKEHNDTKKGTITRLTRDNALICAHEYLGYSDETSEKGRKQIDFILVSPGVLPALIRGGYRPYSEGIASDHRCLFTDIDADILFGKGTGNLSLPAVRNLNTKYPKRKIKYVQEVKELFKKSEVYQRLAKIRKEALAKKDWHPHLQRAYDKLDEEVTEIMLACEKRCNPSKFGPYSWSTPLIKKVLRSGIGAFCSYKQRKGIFPTGSSITHWKERTSKSTNSTQ